MANVAPGTPHWVDLGSPDPEASRRFYGELFGWTADVSTDPQFGGYATCRKDGKAVAGIGGKMSQDQPTVWSTYVATDDANATAAKVEENGGKVVAPPFDIGDFGRMAVFADPAGAFFAVWQAGTMTGGELFNVPGSVSWNELTTRDPDGAKAFYGAVFGWQPKDMPSGDVTYTMWELGGRQIGGMMPMTGDAWAPEIPPHWMVYFAVEDADAAAAKATELGGQVQVPPTDIPVGRFAVLTDPHGAVFSVLTLTEPTPWP